MKNFISVLLVLAFATQMFGQYQHHYTYDNAGNRIKRELIFRFAPQDDPPVALKALKKDSIQATAAGGVMVFKVYPNPNNGQFQVATDNFKEGAWLELVDMSGRQVHQQQIIEPLTKVDITRAGVGAFVLICRDKTQVLGRWKVVSE